MDLLINDLIKLCSALILFFTLVLSTSCDRTQPHVDYDCGIIKSKISEVDHSIGSYDSMGFSRDISSNFEEAAIQMIIEEISRKTGCFEFTLDPQIIETISISSSMNVVSGGIEYSPGENLNELFNIHNAEQTYSISEFINAQAADPTLFHDESDEMVLQLLNKPDVTINQAFEIIFSFDDSETLTVTTSNFEVSN